MAYVIGKSDDEAAAQGTLRRSMSNNHFHWQK